LNTLDGRPFFPPIFFPLFKIPFPFLTFDLEDGDFDLEDFLADFLVEDFGDFGDLGVFDVLEVALLRGIFAIKNKKKKTKVSFAILICVFVV
jgi:hypothetical protein